MPSQNDPLKAPIVYLYDYAGRLLTSSIEKLGLGLVEFTYEYDDEEEDKCTIRVQADSPEALDNLNITRNTVLKVKWGYIGGPQSPIATIAVRDISSNYSPGSLYSEYKCTDLTTFLKTTRSADIQKISLHDFLTNYVIKNANVVIQSGNDVIFKQAKGDVGQSGIKFDDVMGMDGNPIVYDPFYRLLRGEKLTLPRQQAESYAGQGIWFVDKGNEVRDYFEKEIDMVSTNRSPYTVVSEYLNTCPFGPWFLTGRGNTLLIHNRNLGNKIFRSYNWSREPGDLMDFVPETKYDAFEKQAISNVNIDPFTRDANYLEIYINRLKTMRGFKEIVEDTKITKAERDKQLLEFINIYSTDFQIWKIQVQKINVYDNQPNRNITPNDDIPKGKQNPQKPAMLGDHMNTAGLGKYVGYVLQYTIPLYSIDDIQKEQENTMRKLEMETEEASIIVEGDPYLMSEFVVNINHVQRVHQGNYYIKKCKHTISDSGYKTTLETLKVKNSAIIKGFNTVARTELSEKEQKITLNVKEFFQQQHEIFQHWGIEIIIHTIKKNQEQDYAGMEAPYKNKILNVNDLLDDPTKTDQQKLDEILPLINDPDRDISYNLLPEPF